VGALQPDQELGDHQVLELIPRIIYVRFKDAGGTIWGTYQDDILLDETPPQGHGRITSASTGETQLALTASDDVSGVGTMRLSSRQDFAGASWEPYHTSRSWSFGQDSAVYLQFRDNAGNVSPPLKIAFWRLFAPLMVEE
jgi:hypothetical protein